MNEYIYLLLIAIGLFGISYFWFKAGFNKGYAQGKNDVYDICQKIIKEDNAKLHLRIQH